jgi:ATP-dependent DNA ligase
MITLHKISPNGAHLLWSIEKHLGSQLVIYWGQHNGAVQSKIDQVHVNLSGRTIDEQMELEMQSRINSQIDNGYRYTLEEAKAAKGKNALNLPRPMLAKVYDKQDLSSCFMQYKYNGHRCLITRQGDELIAYSRNGKIIETIGHILDGIDIPEGTTLDGELYIHGMALQTISSLVRKVQEDNYKLKYIVYDQISNVRFADRYGKLLDYRLGNNARLATTHPSYVWESLERAKEAGYEGLIARQNNKGYEAGKRSDQLLKIE